MRSNSDLSSELPRRKLAAVLALMVLSSVLTTTDAKARGGRTTAADCAAGSDDPDCPDTDTKKK